MRNTFNVLFYIKKNAPLRNGNVPIMGRITINGERTQFSTRLSVAPEHWDVGMGRVAGRSNAAGRINEQLSNIHYHIERCYNKLFYEQSFVTPMMVKEMYFGANLRQETVLAFFRQHNEEFNRMVGISRSKATYYMCSWRRSSSWGVTTTRTSTPGNPKIPIVTASISLRRRI